MCIRDRRHAERYPEAYAFYLPLFPVLMTAHVPRALPERGHFAAVFQTQTYSSFVHTVPHPFLFLFDPYGKDVYKRQVLFVLMTAKLVGAPVWSVLDTILPSIPLMHAFGRVGCFTAGCCYGIPSDWGFYFDASPIAPHGVRLLPVQLIESACLLVLFFLMYHYGKQKRLPGKMLAFYLIGYGVIRFILEFFRYDAFRGI